MGKTYKREKQYKRAREDRDGDNARHRAENDRSERKRLARDYKKRNWRDLEDGD